MGKKPAKGNTSEVTMVKEFEKNYENYIRFGYRFPGGLVVTRVNGQIGGEDGIPLPISFIDRAPICMNGAINFDHLHDVLIFAVEEKVKKQALLDEQAEGIPLLQYSEEAIDSYMDSKGQTINPSEISTQCQPSEMVKGKVILAMAASIIGPDTFNALINDECDHLNGYCKGEDQCTEPGFPG